MVNVPLSVVILTQNEEKTIERSIKSVGFASEILLIDNSSDKTVEIAKKTHKNIKIIKDENSENFARIRNDALSKTKYEWVLFLDADEEVSEGLADEISRVMRDEHMNGYMINRKDFFLGKWLHYGETGSISLLKLGRKTKGNWQRRVHEVWEIEGEVGVLQQSLFHYPHPTIAEFLAHINRWTTLDAQEFYDKGKRSSFFKIAFYPSAKFIKNYFFKLGFLDGMPGLIMAIMMSFHSFLTRGKLYLIQNGKKP